MYKCPLQLFYIKRRTEQQLTPDLRTITGMFNHLSCHFLFSPLLVLKQLLFFSFFLSDLMVNDANEDVNQISLVLSHKTSELVGFFWWCLFMLVVSGVNIINTWEFSLKSLFQSSKDSVGCDLRLWAINGTTRIRSWSWMSLSFWKEQHFSVKTWLGSGFSVLSCCWNVDCGCFCVHIYMKRCVKKKGNREKKMRVFHFS